MQSLDWYIQVMAVHYFTIWIGVCLFHTFPSINVILHYNLLTYISAFLVLAFGWIKKLHLFSFACLLGKSNSFWSCGFPLKQSTYSCLFLTLLSSHLSFLVDCGSSFTLRIVTIYMWFEYFPRLSFDFLFFFNGDIFPAFFDNCTYEEINTFYILIQCTDIYKHIT